MSRSLAAFIGLLQIVLNLVGLAAFFTAAVWLAVLGRWLEIGEAVLAGVAGAALLWATGLACDNLVWLGEARRASGGGPAAAMTRTAGLLASLAFTGAWVWALFTFLRAPDAVGPRLHVLLLYGVAVVAAWIAGVVQMGMATARPGRMTFAAFNTLASHLLALASGACVVLGWSDKMLWGLAAALVVAAAAKLMLAGAAAAEPQNG